MDIFRNSTYLYPEAPKISRFSTAPLKVEQREKIITDVKSMTISQPQKDELILIIQIQDKGGSASSSYILTQSS